MVQASSAIERIASVYLRPEFARNDTTRQDDPQSSREREADAKIRETRRQRLYVTAEDAEKAAELYGRDGRTTTSRRTRSSDIEPAREAADQGEARRAFAANLKAAQASTDTSKAQIDRTA
jgi:hypothetical protein